MTTAELTERKGALQAMQRCLGSHATVQSLLAGSGYLGQPLAQAVREALGEAVTLQTARRSQ